MGERRFIELRNALLEAGLARRNARRAVMELEDHFAQLVALGISRGASEQDARAQAHASLGTDQTLIERYAARPELQAWSSRRPAIWFTLAPLCSYLALSAATMAVLVVLSQQMHDYLRHLHVAPRVSHLIDLTVQILILWTFPLLVAAALSVFAYRRRIALRWPN